MANRNRHAAWDVAVDPVKVGAVGDGAGTTTRAVRTGAVLNTTDSPRVVGVFDVYVPFVFGVFGVLVALLFGDD